MTPEQLDEIRATFEERQRIRTNFYLDEELAEEKRATQYKLTSALANSVGPLLDTYDAQQQRIAALEDALRGLMDDKWAFCWTDAQTDESFCHYCGKVITSLDAVQHAPDCAWVAARRALE